MMSKIEIKNRILNDAKKVWPTIVKASDLPYPEYWKGLFEYLGFHAPHVGDRLMATRISAYVAHAAKCEKRGEKPVAPVVSEEVKAIWRVAEERRKNGVWEHAAELAYGIKQKFYNRGGKINVAVAR